MKRNQRFIALCLVMLLSSFSTLFANGQKEEVGEDVITIAYIGYSNTTPFWITLGNVAEEAAKAQGVKFINLTPTEPDATLQKNAFDNAIIRGVDGIIIGSVDNRAFEDSLNKAKAAGIYVAAVDTQIDNPQVTSLVQTDNLKSAAVAGKYIVENTELGKVLILGGTLGHQTGNARRDGVKNVVEAAGYEVIFRACDWDDAKAYETATNELNANSDIVAIFSAWDPGALSALAAVKEKGVLGDVVIVGFDGNPANLKSIKSGEVTATIKQDNETMAKECVSNLIKQINGEDFNAFLPIDGFIIDASNVDDYL
ncbi:MAG: sugar ABC transporter substrate-binding protein [Spirochaetaceae bacterium]